MERTRTIDGYDDLRRRHCDLAMALAPEMIGRLDWPAERLAAHRRAELRRLLATTKAKSPWHARRLEHVDPATFEERDLADIPPMTKHDLMEHFDEIVTDRRLTLAGVEDHLAGLKTDAYFLDRYHAVASSGSTGRRGVFVFGWEAWAARWLSNARPTLRALAGVDRRNPSRELVCAMVAASHPTHGTCALTQTFEGVWRSLVRLPAMLPVPQIVAGLNETQPDVLIGFPSSLGPLAAEAEQGRLRIRPRAVVSTSESLLPSVRQTLEQTFDVPVTNVWSASEAGGLAASCPAGHGMHLADDLVIVEPADGAVRLTNLYNPTLPLIRYELNDDVTFLDGPCPCGSGHRRVGDVRGRLDDTFVYGAVSVNPLAFTSPLSRQRHVADYQVRQTQRGAEVAVRCLGPIDATQMENEVRTNLLRFGLADPEVVIRPVEQLERLHTGKLQRFVPLSA